MLRERGRHWQVCFVKNEVMKRPNRVNPEYGVGESQAGREGDSRKAPAGNKGPVTSLLALHRPTDQMNGPDWPQGCSELMGQFTQPVTFQRESC